MKHATQEQADAMIADLMKQRKEYISMIVSGQHAVIASVLFIDAVMSEYVKGYVPDYSEIEACTNNT